jgi:hypothetical protein
MILAYMPGGCGHWLFHNIVDMAINSAHILPSSKKRNARRHFLTNLATEMGDLEVRRQPKNSRGKPKS